MSKLKYINKNHTTIMMDNKIFEDSLTVTFGVLFGLCLSLIIVTVITIPLILIMKHKLSKTNTGKQQIIIIIMTLQTS